MYETKCTFCEGTGERLRPYAGPGSHNGLVKGPCEYCGGTGKWKHDDEPRRKPGLALYIVGGGVLASLAIGLIAGIASRGRDQTADSSRPVTLISSPGDRATVATLSTGALAGGAFVSAPNTQRRRSPTVMVRGQSAPTSPAADNTDNSPQPDQTYYVQPVQPIQPTQDTARTDTSDTGNQIDANSSQGDNGQPADTAQNGSGANTGDNVNPASDNQPDNSGGGDSNNANGNGNSPQPNGN